MSRVYVIDEAGCTAPLARVRVRNEDTELQQLLENNAELLAGDQMDPEDPRRWLLIRREMPVPDPGSGATRWSIDFLFADQDAIPTFVECKRFADTRSRREVVGQMLEYAANGHYYWEADELRGIADGYLRSRNTSLEDALGHLRPTDDLDAIGFFDRLAANLREGQVRLVFFLEEAPAELRSLVDFLNRQMERSEVLLVEARQYETPEQRIVVPTLFGYTEQARAVKRAVAVTSAGSRRRWDEASFFEEARRRLPAEQADSVRALYESAVRAGCDVSWGTGKRTGSFNIRIPQRAQRSIYSVYSDGTLALNYGWLNESASAEVLRDQLREVVASRLGLEAPDARSHHYLSCNLWVSKAGGLAEITRELGRGARAPA